MKRFRDTDYFVTEDGRVISTKYGKTKELKQSISCGYFIIALNINNKKRKTFRVHRLVAEVYHPNPNNLSDVEHIDDNKSNNNVSNLEWVTHQENMDRAKNNGLMKSFLGEKHGRSKLTEKDVLWIRQNYIKRDKEFGCKPLSIKFNVSDSRISDIIKRKNWKHI